VRSDGERAHLDAVLAFPGDLRCRAEHAIAPALRHADRDVEAAGRERVQFAAVRRRQIGMRNDEDAPHRYLL
jgi:hypothetical protein